MQKLHIQTPFEIKWLFFQAIACTIGFIHGFQKIDHEHDDDELHDHVMDESLLQFVCKSVEFHTFLHDTL